MNPPTAIRSPQDCLASTLANLEMVAQSYDAKVRPLRVTEPLAVYWSGREASIREAMELLKTEFRDYLEP